MEEGRGECQGVFTMESAGGSNRCMVISCNLRGGTSCDNILQCLSIVRNALNQL